MELVGHGITRFVTSFPSLEGFIKRTGILGNLRGRESCFLLCSDGDKQSMSDGDKHIQCHVMYMHFDVQKTQLYRSTTIHSMNNASKKNKFDLHT